MVLTTVALLCDALRLLPMLQRDSATCQLAAATVEWVAGLPHPTGNTILSCPGVKLRDLMAAS